MNGKDMPFIMAAFCAVGMVVFAFAVTMLPILGAIAIARVLGMIT